jgi:hypothetical protein
MIVMSCGMSRPCKVCQTLQGLDLHEQAPLTALLPPPASANTPSLSPAAAPPPYAALRLHHLPSILRRRDMAMCQSTRYSPMLPLSAISYASSKSSSAAAGRPVWSRQLARARRPLGNISVVPAFRKPSTARLKCCSAASRWVGVGFALGSGGGGRGRWRGDRGRLIKDHCIVMQFSNPLLPAPTPLPTSQYLEAGCSTDNPAA